MNSLELSSPRNYYLWREFTLNLLSVWWIRYNSTLVKMITSIAFSSTKFQLTKQVMECFTEYLLFFEYSNVHLWKRSPSSQTLLSKFTFLETFILIIFILIMTEFVVKNSTIYALERFRLNSRERFRQKFTWFILNLANLENKSIT